MATEEKGKEWELRGEGEWGKQKLGHKRRRLKKEG